MIIKLIKIKLTLENSIMFDRYSIMFHWYAIMFDDHSTAFDEY